MRKTLIPLSLLVLAALAGCADEPPPRPMVQVVVEQVESAAYTPVVRYVGRLQAINDVAIQAKVSGYLLSRDFREGEVVDEGEVLYTIDPSEYQAKLAAARADLAAAVATQANALRTYNRGLELVAKGAISQSEMDKFEADKLESDAGIELAKAQIESAELELGFTTIRAPITGRIGRSAASLGDLVGPTTGDLTNLVSMDPMEAQFQINEATYLERVAAPLRGGIDGEEVQAVQVRLELATGTIYKHVGHIDYIGNRVDQATGTLEARAAMPNPEGVLVPGQYVRVLLTPAGEEQALFLPQSAVQADQRGRFVLVVDEGVVARRDVELGERLDDRVIVHQGVDEGESVIVRGLQQVRPGMPVTTRELTPEEQGA